jgi:diadenosine tetraphosphate (Ap4A) HIT family hydrolase
MHLLAFPKRHVEKTTELTKKEFADLKNVEKFISSFFKEEQYFSFLRETFS